MASVRKREWTHKGETKTAWVVNYTDQGGKRRLKTFDKKKDADSYRTKVESEIEQGVHTPLNETVNVKQAVSEYLKHQHRRRIVGEITGSTLKNNDHYLGGVVVSRIGQKVVSELSSEEMEAFFDEVKLKYAKSTALRIYGMVLNLLKFCVRRRWVKRNILVDEPIKVGARTKRASVPTKRDLRELLASSEARVPREDHLTFLNAKCVIRLCLYCGLRVGEAFGLQWENVDLDNGIIRIRHSYNAIDGLKGPKSKAGIRNVPMPEKVREALVDLAKYWRIRVLVAGDNVFPSDRKSGPWEALSQYSRVSLKQYHEGKTSRRWGESLEAARGGDGELAGHVIIGRLGKPLHSMSWGFVWRRKMENAGLIDAVTDRPKFTAHALRHAAASLYIEAGLPAMNLKELIGHSSVTTTFDVYGYLFPDDKRVEEASRLVASKLEATTERHVSP